MIKFAGRSLIASEAYLNFAAEISRLTLKIEKVHGLIRSIEGSGPALDELRQELADLSNLRERAQLAQEALGETPRISGASVVAELINWSIEMLRLAEADFVAVSQRLACAPLLSEPSIRQALVDADVRSEFFKAFLRCIEKPPIDAGEVVYSLRSHAQRELELVAAHAADWNWFASCGSEFPLLCRMHSKAALYFLVMQRTQDTFDRFVGGGIVSDETAFDLSFSLAEEFPAGFAEKYPVED